MFYALNQGVLQLCHRFRRWLHDMFHSTPCTLLVCLAQVKMFVYHVFIMIIVWLYCIEIIINMRFNFLLYILIP